MMSPNTRRSRLAGTSPARSAEEPGRTRLTTSPRHAQPRGRLLAITTIRSPGAAPCRRGSAAGRIRLTISTGTANPIPDDAPVSDRIAVFTPISRPAESSSGPPELPGLIAASVCTTPRTSRLLGRRQPPVERADHAGRQRPRQPNGLPMAKTDWPTRRSAEVPIGIGRSAVRVSDNRTTARLVVGRDADDRRAHGLAVVEPDVDRPGVLHDMEIGHHMAGPVPQSGPEPAPPPPAGVPGEDVDHRGRGGLEHARRWWTPTPARSPRGVIARGASAVRNTARTNRSAT